MFAKLTSAKLTSAKLTSTKLTSTKLSPNRVSRQACSGLRPEPMPRVATAHANDNHVTRQKPAGATGRPVLTCRWVPSSTGGLECCWFLTDGEATGPDETGEAACMRPPVAAGGRHLTLVAG
jgi:hypothetical protein